MNTLKRCDAETDLQPKAQGQAFNKVGQVHGLCYNLIGHAYALLIIMMLRRVVIMMIM